MRLTFTFFIIAIVAAVFGFGGITEEVAIFAKVLFFISLALFVACLLLEPIKNKQ